MNRIVKFVSGKKIFDPPKCPECGEPLNKVHVDIYETWTFVPSTGEYVTDTWTNEMVQKCPECDSDLSDLFESGVANYQSEKESMEYEVEYDVYDRTDNKRAKESS